ncbi:hypothetical protein PF008_g5904 [Phytophthora fragariae]|uniref:Transmembrane protein n=1 Tax=Phytophthora fragariae TaxID=53985 RepID=A0A6G0S8V3_9STRA|nr:hypothetical protein PF008_g5904 [Phytophthora fragariae]
MSVTYASGDVGRAICVHFRTRLAASDSPAAVYSYRSAARRRSPRTLHAQPAPERKIAVTQPPPRSGSIDVYGDLRKEMTATFDRNEIVSVVSGGKAGYANLKHLNVGSPGSDVSDLGDTADLEELLAQGSSQGPQTHPGIICCAIFSFSGFFLLLIVGCIVSSNSLYIKVRPAEGKPKSSLATSIFLAAFLYLCVFGTSIMYFLRARRAQKVYQLSLDVHAD